MVERLRMRREEERLENWRGAREARELEARSRLATSS